MGCALGAFARPGNRKTRSKRKQLHERFDKVWARDDGPFGHLALKRRRDAAYVWLAWPMQLSWWNTHIGCFDQEQCAEANLHPVDLAIGLFLPIDNQAALTELFVRPEEAARVAARLAEWEALTPEEQEAKRATGRSARVARLKASAGKGTAQDETDPSGSKERMQQ